MTEPHREIAAKELEKVFPKMSYQDRFNYFPQIIYATNPIGASAGYFRRNFVKAATRFSVFDAPLDDGGMKRVYIPFLVKDNPFEDEQRVRSRISGLGDEAMTDALLNENWDAPVGDFIREYDEKRHVTPDFSPPAHWIKFRGFDWGHDEPFCVYWCAVSDGEDFIDDQGRKRWFRRGARVIYREWYGCLEDDSSKGIGLPNKEIAQGIVQRTIEPSSGITLTDSLPFQTRGGELMADEFFRYGCPLTRGNTNREVGWKRLKDLLIGIDGDPLFVITQSCRYLREYLPALQRHKSKVNDAVEDGEATHACDVARLIAMTYETPLPVKPEEPPRPLPPHLRKSVTPLEILSQRKAHGRRR